MLQPCMAAHADDAADFSDSVADTPVPEIIDPVFAKTSQNARFLLSENKRFGLVFVKTGSINSGTDDVTDSPGGRQAGIDLPMSALQTGAEEEDQVKEDAAATTRRQAAPNSSAATASPPSFSTTPGGDSVTGTVVATCEAVVPTGGMGPENEWFKKRKERIMNAMNKGVRDKMEKWLEKKEKQLEEEKEKQLKDERSSGSRRSRSCSWSRRRRRRGSR
jgi:hypothetical protein